MNARSGTESLNTSSSAGGLAFPKEKRILSPKQFRQVYDQGFRVATFCFAAFCLRTGAGSPTRFGFTTSRALGKAHDRNRMRRRVREAVRLHQDGLTHGWDLVFNPRRGAMGAPFSAIEREVVKVFERCKQS
jgi:ribonuclease P protein component